MIIQWKSTLPKFIIATALSLSLLTSCGKIEEPNNSPLVGVDSISKDNTSSDNSSKDGSSKYNSSKELIYKTFEDLVSTNDECSLEIKKKGDERAYKASDMLRYTILDLLQKSEKLDMSVINDSGFDYNKYDYSLKFAGANEILLSIEENTFFMKEDENIYKLWGDSSNFWKSLLTDIQQSTADLPKGQQESMRKVYKHDVDGDGLAEDIELAFYKAHTMDSNGQLKLKVGLSEVSIEDDIGWVTEPFHIMNDAPTVEFIPINKGSIIAVSYSWMTNGVGSTGEIKAYEYKDKRLNEIKIELPEMDFGYEKDEKVKISFPQINRQLTAAPSREEIESLEKNSGQKIENILKEKAGFSPHIYRYIYKDYDGDGETDLCSQSLIRFQLLEDMNLGYLYTIYKYDNGRIVPESVILLPSYNEKDKMRIIKNDVVENLFSLGFLDFSIVEDKELWSNFEFQYGKTDFENAIAQLVKEGYIKKNNQKVFLNI